MAEFIRVAKVGDIPEGGARCVVHRRRRIALYKVNGQIYATDDICSHAEASLSAGHLEGYEVICPLHGARFDIRTGQALCLPAVTPVATYEVRVEGDDVLVKL